MGTMLLEDLDPSACILQYEALASKGSSDGYATFVYASALTCVDRARDSFCIYDQIQMGDASPVSVSWIHEYRGKAFARLHDVTSAIEAYRCAMLADEGASEPVAFLGAALRERELFGESIEVLSVPFLRECGIEEVQIEKASTLRAMCKIDGALAICQGILAKISDHESAAELQRELEKAVLVRANPSTHGLGAIPKLPPSAVIAQFESTGRVEDARSQSLYHYALALARVGRVREALAIYEEPQFIDVPQSHQFLVSLGRG